MIRPRATYRLQFRSGMDFDRAAALAPYLAELGISHLYASPIFYATPGSTHGYDVADFNAIEPEIGGPEGFDRLHEALQNNGIGLILDFVPNHMGASAHNPWWRSVLEWGRDSHYADHFDIDWQAPKLIVPALGKPYGQALADGELGLAFGHDDGGVSFTYYELRLPLTPPSCARILVQLEDEPFPDLARRFAVSTPETAEELKLELAETARDKRLAGLVEEAIAAIVADHDALHGLHEAQAWRLAYWRAARETLTYRRFFEISDLVGVRVERPAVFEDAHRLLLQLVGEGRVHGIRLDHIDGLADPKGYLERLQAAIGGDEPYYLIIEKILGHGEPLRPSWPIAGTTGYEFISALAGLFTDPAGEAPATEAYEAFLGGSVDYRRLVGETKRRILARNLAAELDVLKDQAHALAQLDSMTRDFGADTLRRAILEFATALPVYRTYVHVDGADETDRAVIDRATEVAKATREVEDEEAIEFIRRLLLLEFADPEHLPAALEFATRFQQTTGPVMAKALEDTVFYRFNRMAALNEVGGEPDVFGAPLEAFHQAMRARLSEQPFGLLATATHDTKRGEDARARLYCLTEMPAAWGAAVARWAGMNQEGRAVLEETPAPEPELEWLFYQTLAGAWPPDLQPDDAEALGGLAERMTSYIIKAAREAKLHTSWTAPYAEYEAALEAFVAAALDPARSGPFLRDFAETCRPLFVAGALVSLSQLPVKLAAPGVPDIYQGTELWDLSLVDPDNRRPVDFEPRASLLDRIGNADPVELVGDWRSARLKMRLLAAGLRLRAEAPELFANGDYLPLEAEGAEAGRVVAFARTHEGKALVLVAPRLVLPLLEGCETPHVPDERWGDAAVRLPEALRRRDWRDAVTGQSHSFDEAIPVAAALGRFPVALLMSG
ncbi:MAG TPA: malto-oligosyltrehalose synthase [Afifellaceae bacterium]|nr:malto-oligosyltrehalose synthase [Afifellaceae bacterium]